MNNGKLWFAAYNESYNGIEPYFFEKDTSRVAIALEQQSAEIIEELQMLWRGNNDSVMKNYGDDGLQFPPKTWSKLVFKVWGLKNKGVCDRFDLINALLTKYPEITSCFVSKTAPHSSIKPHCGETNATIRIHLGLFIPESTTEQCGMQVGDKVTTWKVGKTFAFLDAHKHTVWNKTDKERYVLIVDIVRPQFAGIKKYINARILINQVFFGLAEKLNLKSLYKTPSVLLAITALVCYLPLLFINYINDKAGLLKI